jgi:DNA-binding transcriptional LysR family regulator
MNAEPSWDLYRTFLAVLREGSLSGAARSLALTQPTIARHIDALEASIGVDLFVRSQHGLMPTETALNLKPYAEALASTAAALLRTASNGVTDEIKGTVRITASEVVGVEHLPPILARLRQRHPNLVVELSLSDDADDLLRREADIAVRMFPPVQDALIAKRLPPLMLGLYAHRDYLERRGMPCSIEDLRDHDLIGFDQETPALRAFVDQFPFLSRSRFALRTNSNLAQLALIRAGFGLGICQVSLANRDATFVRVLQNVFDVPLDLWVVMHEDVKRSPPCRAVFDSLADALADISGS